MLLYLNVKLVKNRSKPISLSLSLSLSVFKCIVFCILPEPVDCAETDEKPQA
jgi:hypothetical protein